MMNLPLYAKSPDYHWYPKQVWTTSKKQSSHPQFCQFSLFYCAWHSAGPRLLKSLQKEIADVFGPPSLHFFSFPHSSASPGAAILNYLGVVVDGRGDCLLQQTACSGLLQGTNCGQKANKWKVANCKKLVAIIIILTLITIFS